MIYKILIIISTVIIILFLIGLRGVQVDTFLSEELRNKFLIKYSIILIISSCVLFFSVFKTRRNND